MYICTSQTSPAACNEIRHRRTICATAKSFEVAHFELKFFIYCLVKNGCAQEATKKINAINMAVALFIYIFINKKNKNN